MASSDSQREFTEVELAYRSWLIAAKEAASADNTWAALGRLILREVTLSERGARAAEAKGAPEAARLRQQADELASGTEKWTKDAGKQLGIWHARATLGAATPALQQVLVRVVEHLAAPPHDVGEWVSFTEVVRHLTREKQHQQLDAVHKSQERGLDTQAEAIRGLLVPGGLTTGAGLDPLALGLGSWAFDGDLPPYVSRPEVDQQLETAISNRGRHHLPARRGHDAAGGLTVVAGPPKSGKSRTLLEAIRAHAPAAPVWWVNPAPDVVPRLAERAEKYLAGDGGQQAPKKDREGLIIVIDDAQRCGSNPMSGLSEQALAQLARHAHVILTLHEQTITQWTAQVHDRSTPGYTDTTRLTSDVMLTVTQFAGIGATQALIDLLNQGRVDVPAQIEVDQLTEFTSVLGTSQRVDRDADGLAQLPPDPLRVAEYFAAVDALRAKALTARASGGYPAALIDALIDATKLLPAGITPPTLELLTSHHLALVAPTRLFAQDHYQAALDWATTPIGGPGSPHAIMQVTTDRDRYLLFDGIVTTLTPDQWTPAHLQPLREQLPPEALFAAGRHYHHADAHDEAANWYHPAAANGNTNAMVNLGFMAYEGEDSETARYWYTRAAEYGNTTAMCNLGATAKSEGDLETARYWYTRAAQDGNTYASVLLAIMAREDGDRSAERDWYTRAATKGNTYAMLVLGVLARKDGDSDTARDWSTRAAENGDVLAMAQLGLMAYDDGDLETARDWFTRAAENGSTHARAVLEQYFD